MHYSSSAGPPSAASFPHRSRAAVLGLCCLLALLQLLFLHRRLLSPMSPVLAGPSSPPSAADGQPLLIPNVSDQSSAAGELLGRLPHCLIIGVRKGGTRALLDALALHPRVKPARHEVHFFDKENFYKLGPDWYRAQMPPTLSGEIVIEKTPAYFTNQKVPARVHQLNPQMKLILIVREPVTRLVSDFTQIQQTKRERRKTTVNFQRMSFVSNGSGSPLLNTRFKAIRNSLYSKHFAQWRQFFPLQQFLVLDGDKFIRDPLSQIRLAERFLGIGPGVGEENLVFNPNKGFYCFRRGKTMPIHCLGQSKGRKQIPIDRQFRQLMAASFAPFNKQFFAQINRKFPGWTHNK